MLGITQLWIVGKGNKPEPYFQISNPVPINQTQNFEELLRFLINRIDNSGWVPEFWFLFWFLSSPLPGCRHAHQMQNKYSDMSTAIVKLQAKSLAWELTLFYPCYNNQKNKRNNPQQNLSEGGVLEVWNLTHQLLMGLRLSLGGQGSEGPKSHEEQEQHNYTNYKICV